MASPPQASLEVLIPRYHDFMKSPEGKFDLPSPDEKKERSSSPQASFVVFVLSLVQILLLGAAEYIITLETSIPRPSVKSWLPVVYVDQVSFCSW